MDINCLESKRKITDPVADQVIESILNSGQLVTVNNVFGKLMHNVSIPEGLPRVVEDYFQSTAQLPQWADQQKIKIAQNLFQIYGSEICMVLLCKSLPECYACSKGVKVLYNTGRLLEQKNGSLHKFTRRLMETTQFVVDVLAEGGFDSNGAGIITAQKVRLIHAGIRYYLRKSGWDTTKFDEPINQEDMAGTLMTFSATVVQGLEMLGINWNAEQKEAYIHTWNIVGYVMGVEADLLPSNYDDAVTLVTMILNDQKGYSEEGKELTKACTDFMEQLIPGNLFDGIAPEMVYFFLGEMASCVGVTSNSTLWEEVLPRLLKLFYGTTDHLLDHSAAMRAIAKPFTKYLLQGMINYFNDYKQVRFDIPPSLQKDWNMVPAWQNKRILSPEILGYRLVVQQES